MAMFSNFLTNYTSGIRNKTKNNNAYADIMSSVMIVPSLNSSSLNHKYDGFIYLSDLLIQFSATTDVSQNLSANVNFTLNFPIASKPFAVYVSPLNPSTAAPTVSIINSSITDVSCNVRIGGNTGQLFWYSIGPAPTTPIYTNIINAFTTINLLFKSNSVSSNGQYQYCASGSNSTMGVIGAVYINSNYGYGAWTQKNASSGINYSSIKTNSSGKYVYATNNGGYIYYSSNYGSNWQSFSTSSWGTINPIQNWSCITCDSSGQYIFAGVKNGGIYYSSDYGNTWNVTNAPSKAWTSIACNSTGTQVVACVNATSNGGIWISNNNSGSWNQTSANQTLPYYSITSDSTGQYLAVARNGGTIFYSLNYGTTWYSATDQNGSSLTQNWTSISSNSTGQYLTATAAQTQNEIVKGIWYSNDYAISWTNIYSARDDFMCVSMDSTGNVGNVCTNQLTYVSLNASN